MNFFVWFSVQYHKLGYSDGPFLWIHLVAALLGLGCLFTAPMIALPAFASGVGQSRAFYRSAGRLVSRAHRAISVSLIVLLFSGLLCLALTDHPARLFSFADRWSALLSAKLILFLALAAVHIYGGAAASSYIQRLDGPRGRTANHSPVVESFRRYAKIEVALCAAILLLAAYMAVN